MVGKASEATSGSGPAETLKRWNCPGSIAADASAFQSIREAYEVSSPSSVRIGFLVGKPVRFHS